MLNNSDVREYAKKSGVKLWELAQQMNISEPTMTRKLRIELSDADKAAIISHIDAIVENKAKEKAATA